MRRRILLGILLCSVLGLAVLVRLTRFGLVRYDTAVFAGQWVTLSEEPWVRASTGWVAIGNDGLPKRDTSFIGTPLAIGDRTFDSGLGAFAPSEVAYDLDAQSALF